LVKADSTGYFQHRVQPFDTATSWLFERLTTDNQTLGRMPLYAEPLSDVDMNRIKNWIMDGAKDIYGNQANLPNTPPLIDGYIALNQLSEDADKLSDINNRLDHSFFNPFKVDSGITFYILFSVSDDNTSIAAMQFNKLKISQKQNDFSSADTHDAQYVILDSTEYWYVEMKTNNFFKGDTLFMRYFINDGYNSDIIEYPTNESQSKEQLKWAFYINK
jgi:hypothetical protein